MVPSVALAKNLDVKEAFKQFIRSHYFDDADNYDEALTSLMDLRQAMRTPSRNSQGVALLLQYYNQLHFVERRFFTPDKTMEGIFGDKRQKCFGMSKHLKEHLTNPNK